jgi:hypothetical protein
LNCEEEEKRASSLQVCGWRRGRRLGEHKSSGNAKLGRCSVYIKPALLRRRLLWCNYLFFVFGAIFCRDHVQVWSWTSFNCTIHSTEPSPRHMCNWTMDLLVLPYMSISWMFLVHGLNFGYVGWSSCWSYPWVRCL